MATEMLSLVPDTDAESTNDSLAEAFARESRILPQRDFESRQYAPR